MNHGANMLTKQENKPQNMKFINKAHVKYRVNRAIQYLGGN